MTGYLVNEIWGCRKGTRSYQHLN